MKRDFAEQNIHNTEVAPRRGAWIETFILVGFSLSAIVAPRRGAWIETLC